MIRLIAHRGNINGPDPTYENSPDYVLAAVSIGFDVEVDVWLVKDVWYLGHDEPQYIVDLSFLKNKRLWCHAKNLEAFHEMIRNGIHCFWHQDDDYTMTSQSFIWAYPGKNLTKQTICVMPEKSDYSNETLHSCLGICSDYPLAYQEKLSNKRHEKIKVILFDLDGVLVDACDWHYHALNEALANVAGINISIDEHMKTFNGLPTKKKLQILTDQGRVLDNQHDDIWKEKQRLTVSVIEKYACIDYDKKLMHKSLRSCGFILGCVTNSIRRTADLMLSRTGQIKHLSLLVTNEDVENPKPKPDSFNRAMKILGVSPDEVLIVEDSDKGFLAAKASGAHVLRVTNATEVNFDALISKLNLIQSKEMI
jgi:beta-phosphoglucomutase-like phosphatase (HAD superfamily)